MHPVREEIQNLLDQMKAKALQAADPVLERETDEIAALVYQQAIPDVNATASKSLISTHAQAVLMRAHLRHLAWKSSGVLELSPR